MKPGSFDDRLAEAIRSALDQPDEARRSMLQIRDEALAAGDSRMATACLKALRFAMPTAEWIAEYSDELIREEPTSRSFLSRGVSFRALNRRSDAMRDYLKALELEGPNGDSSIVEEGLLYIANLCGLSLPLGDADQGSEESD